MRGISPVSKRVGEGLNLAPEKIPAIQELLSQISNIVPRYIEASQLR